MTRRLATEYPGANLTVGCRKAYPKRDIVARHDASEEMGRGDVEAFDRRSRGRAAADGRAEGADAYDPARPAIALIMIPALPDALCRPAPGPRDATHASAAASAAPAVTETLEA